MTYIEILCLAVLEIGMPKAHFACDHMEMLATSAQDNGLPAELVIALIHYESNWNPRAVSSAKACGLMQVMPKYTKKPKKTCRQLKDPWVNIRVGTRTLHRWIKKYGKGNVAKGLCGYSSGYTCGKRYNRKHQGWRYSRRVLKYAERLMKQVDYIEECIENRLKDKDEEYHNEGCSC